MKVTELRIGNIVAHKGVVTRVDNIGWMEINSWRDMGVSGACQEKDLSAIGLNETVLKKCGFAVEGPQSWEHLTLVEPKTGYTICLIQDREVQCQRTGVFLYELHRLQNLYHSLYGAELPIQMP